jgi:hypothetical protein
MVYGKISVPREEAKKETITKGKEKRKKERK